MVSFDDDDCYQKKYDNEYYNYDDDDDDEQQPRGPLVLFKYAASSQNLTNWPTSDAET